MTSFEQLADLSGRLALVTGGRGGIGRVLAETLVDLGARVLVSDLPGRELPKSSEEGLLSSGAKSEFFPADFTKQGDMDRLGAYVDLLPKLDIVVHCAGLVGSADLDGWNTDFVGQTVETWDFALKVNLTSAFSLAKAVYPSLRRSSGGVMILLSSIYAFLGPDPGLYVGSNMSSPAAYFASKGGIEQLGRWLASTWAPEIRVNMLCPGGVFRGQPSAFVDRYVAKTPLARMASEDDFRGPIGFLCSDLSRYMTGQSLIVDGGISIR
jgi:NAD(P)-dependent dehydrogenase (short-subunit alcohol dehydrogenase family)